MKTNTLGLHAAFIKMPSPKFARKRRMPHDVSLEALGLLQLLERIERGSQVMDPMVRDCLVRRGLILAGPRIELSAEGKQALTTLGAARQYLLTECAGDTRAAAEAELPASASNE